MIIDWNDPKVKEAMMQAATDPTYPWRQDCEVKDKEIALLRRDLEIWRRNGGDILLHAEIERLNAIVEQLQKTIDELEDKLAISRISWP